LLAQAPDRLVEGGTLQLLCEWSEIDGESWQDRVTSALAGQHCDLLVLHGAAVLPADYVGHRAAAIRAEDEAADRGDAAWDRYLEERSVVAVHPGMVVLKRRSEPGWTHWVDLRAAPDGQSARVLGQYMETLDFLTLCEDDEILLESVVAVAPGIAMAHGQAGADGLLRLERREGLPIAVDVDRAGIAFLEHGPAHLCCADFFALRREHVAPAALVYDRAALVALPGPQQGRYLAQLCALMPPAFKGLLVTLEYDQSEMQGPPFAAPSAALMRHLAGDGAPARAARRHRRGGALPRAGRDRDVGAHLGARAR